MRSVSCLLLAAAIVASPAVAFAADPAAARAQLEAGYALKEQGKYADALPHFQESLRLDPQLKTLTNLADCEDHLGQLVDAQQHWVMARDRAGAEGNERLRASAEARLTALESRLPRLTIKVAPDSPPGTEVVRDGTVLGAISLGAPLPTNTGAHSVVARAPGFAEQTFTVTLQEAEQKELFVHAGAALPPAAIAVAPVATAPVEPDASSSWNNRRTAAVIAGGVGVVGAGLGIAFGLSTGSSWSDAQHDCGKGCSATSTAASERSTALTDATISDVSFAVAGIALAAGAVLWFTAPKHHEAPRPLDAVRIVPSLGKQSSGVAVLGEF